MDKQSEEELAEKHPLPDDFYAFLPFACNQFQVDFTVTITKDLQHDYVSVGHQDRMKRGKSKAKIQSRLDVGSDEHKDGKSDAFQSPMVPVSKNLQIIATYDAFDNLIKLKFTKNKRIPRMIWKIISLMIQFQPYLTNITIIGGIDQYTIYEITKFLNFSQITELILDYSILFEANYYLLFETENNLRHVSLAGCEIDDAILDTIASKLSYPLPSSKKLRILNLSVNKITDKGAKRLALALRSNRLLTYLNLAGNRLGDAGAGHILNVLTIFPLTSDEIMASRQRLMEYLRHKNTVINKILQELKAGDFDKRAAKRKSLRPPSTPSTKKGDKKLDKETSLKSLVDPNPKSLLNVDLLLYDKAMTLAENAVGEFVDPFSSNNTFVRDGITYCKGNNALFYLNLSYLNLTYLSANKILNVLRYQKSSERRPTGLINIIVEGNPMPIYSLKLNEIDDIIDRSLESHRRMSGVKKRPHSKK